MGSVCGSTRERDRKRERGRGRAVCVPNDSRAVPAGKVINSNYVTKNNLKTLQHFCKRPTHTPKHTHTHSLDDFISSYLLPATCQVFDFISGPKLQISFSRVQFG